MIKDMIFQKKKIMPNTFKFPSCSFTLAFLTS